MAKALACWMLLIFNHLQGQNALAPLPARLLPVAQFFQPKMLGTPQILVTNLNLPLAPTHPGLPEWTPDCLPFFCKIEYRILKQTALPFKFRLGAVDYVDWLEGKNRFDSF